MKIKKKKTLLYLKNIIYNFMIFLTLSSCVFSSKPEDKIQEETNKKTKNMIVEKIKNDRQNVLKSNKTASFSSNYEINGDNIKIELYLKNPENKNIRSIRSFLSYDSRVLQGIDIKVNEDVFDIIAPDEKNFDSDFGLVKIGISTTKSFSESKVKFAEINFKRLEKSTVMLDFYNIGEHTVVYSNDNEKLSDILIPPKIPAIIVPFSP